MDVVEAAVHTGGEALAVGTTEALKCTEDTERRASVPSVSTVVSVVPLAAVHAGGHPLEPLKR